MKKEYPPGTYMLEITSFVGLSIGAEHYYAKLIGSEYNKHPLVRPLSLEEAQQLDIKDQSGGLHQRAHERAVRLGDTLTTERFNTKEEIYTAAIKYCDEHGIDILIEGSFVYVQSQKVIKFPCDDTKGKLNAQFKKLEKLNTNNPANDDEWDEIDRVYFKLLNSKLPK